MNKKMILAVAMAAVLLLTACAPITQSPETTVPPYVQEDMVTKEASDDAIKIDLSDKGITVDGNSISTDATAAIYAANDIVFYLKGQDFTYGEGTKEDEHSQEEADQHTVVHITEPGQYILSGKLSAGQIAVDLGKDVKDDPNAVVTLVLNNVDITCTVAPAIIFYNVYECGTADEETAQMEVDTSAAGANVIIADGTVNHITGSYVEKIYKPESVVLSEDQTEVEDAKKLHKYDGAFYSRCSMNIFGGKDNTGVLNIKAENEGLDTELHLTVNGGNIYIESGNDGINTNEDGVSVTTVNGGTLSIRVTGETGEGDGIDSNGYLVINGGTVTAAACSTSADAGIDSDLGIHINGGTVIATGHMLDQIQSGGQNYAVFNFAQRQTGGETVVMKDASGAAILETMPQNSYSILIFSSPQLKAGTYTLWSDGTQLAGSSGGMMGGFGGGMGRPDNGQPPEGAAPPQGGEPAGDFTPPDGQTPPDKPEGDRFGGQGGNWFGGQEQTPEFQIRDGGNMFSGISAK